MDIKQYLDSTYLKTAEQAGLTPEENLKLAEDVIVEAIENKFKLVMIRPDVVKLAKSLVGKAGSAVLVGTVIDFPEGRGGLAAKTDEALKAIQDGADELDFVVDYQSFLLGEPDKVRNEVYECTKLCLEHGKTVKWIIEVAALGDHQVVQLCALIKNVVLTHFDEVSYNKVFVKSSTGFYKTEAGKPNGATMHAVKLMLENSFPLPVKAAGGVRTYEEAVEMINIGVSRIGTSSAKAIATGSTATDGY